MSPSWIRHGWRAAAIAAAAITFAACGSTAEYERTPEAEATARASQPTPAGSAAALPPAPQAPPLLEVSAPSDRDLLRPVSKRHALGEGYQPPDLVTLPASLVAPGYPERQLRREAAGALAAMVAAAARDGLELRVVSAYRSYSEQVVVHQRLAERAGDAEASRRSAPPGHSEHQLGTTVDISGRSAQWRLTRRLGEMPEGRWLAARAYEYGFALSYPEGAEAVTGYLYEPWHLRYIGRGHAARWHESGLTLVEYLEALDPE